MLNFMTWITWLHHETIEAQLAYVNSGSVRGIYNHTQYLDKRREMMQWWAVQQHRRKTHQSRIYWRSAYPLPL